MDILLLPLIAIIAGLLSGLLIGKRWGQAAGTAVSNQAQQQLTTKQAELDRLQQRWDSVQQELGELRAGKQMLEKQLQEQEKVLLEKVEQLTHKMLIDSRHTLHETHKTTLGDVLQPFQEKLATFEKQVQEAFEKEIRDKSILAEKLNQLHQLNQQLSDDARNLTNALKADNKKQGNWGELILEKVLESSGLTKGREYELQYSDRNQDGDTIRPDAIVHLPENRHVIIDSKVSLVAYVEWNQADEEVARQSAMKAHILSVRSHINGLSSRQYQTAEGLNSPDYILLFIPIEGALMLALQEGSDLFAEAWKKGVVLVSPTTLLATLRTIEAIWRMENQNKNVKQIAALGGRMFDKLAGIIEDMKSAEAAILKAGDRLQDATKKMHTGKGNLASMAERMKALGADTKRELPADFQQEEEQD